MFPTNIVKFGGIYAESLQTPWEKKDQGQSDGEN